jgi:hypothetical protein
MITLPNNSATTESGRWFRLAQTHFELRSHTLLTAGMILLL